METPEYKNLLEGLVKKINFESHYDQIEDIIDSSELREAAEASFVSMCRAEAYKSKSECGCELCLDDLASQADIMRDAMQDAEMLRGS